MSVEVIEISARIRSFIAHDLLFTDSEPDYVDDDSFLEQGIIDSLGILNLVLFVEEEFGLSVPDGDVIPDHFDSITRLVAYVQRRLDMSGL